MRSKSSLAALAALSLLAACAPVSKFVNSEFNTAKPSRNSPYGLFLAGQAANALGDNQAASRYYAAAKAAGATGPGVDAQVFMAALNTGDIALAAKLAPPKPEDEDDELLQSTYQLGVLVRLANLMAAGNGKGAGALVRDEPVSLLRSTAAQLQPWIQLMSGETPSLLESSPMQGRAINPALILTHARLAQAAGRMETAETDFKLLTSNGLGAVAAIDYGAFLERQGRAAEAKSLYEAAPDRLDTQAALKRLNAGGKPPAAPTARQGAAQVLFAQADAMGRAGADQLRVTFIRLGLTVDPSNVPAMIGLGDAMAAEGESDAALAIYQRVSSDPIQGVSVMARIAALYQQEERSADALKIGQQALAAAPNDPSIASVYASILAENGRYADAVKVYDDVLAKSERPDWRLYYERWRILLMDNRPLEGEAGLQAGLKIAPDEPALLNALGYSWIDRGERMSEAMSMIRRAVAADPENGQIVDSLGWGYYRMGDYASAVEQLERASEMEPSEPEIIDHLGDAYWRAGRPLLARYQWSRILTLDPDAEMKAKAQSKLRTGLPSETSPRTAASAAASGS